MALRLWVTASVVLTGMSVMLQTIVFVIPGWLVIEATNSTLSVALWYVVVCEDSLPGSRDRCQTYTYRQLFDEGGANALLSIRDNASQPDIDFTTTVRMQWQMTSCLILSAAAIVLLMFQLQTFRSAAHQRRQSHAHRLSSASQVQSPARKQSETQLHSPPHQRHSEPLIHSQYARNTHAHLPPRKHSPPHAHSPMHVHASHKHSPTRKRASSHDHSKTSGRASPLVPMKHLHLASPGHSSPLALASSAEVNAPTNHSHSSDNKTVKGHTIPSEQTSHSRPSRTDHSQAPCSRRVKFIYMGGFAGFFQICTGPLLFLVIYGMAERYYSLLLPLPSVPYVLIILGASALFVCLSGLTQLLIVFRTKTSRRSHRNSTDHHAHQALPLVTLPGPQQLPVTDVEYNGDYYGQDYNAHNPTFCTQGTHRQDISTDVFAGYKMGRHNFKGHDMKWWRRVTFASMPFGYF